VYELNANHYVKTEVIPQVVSSLGAIPKPDGSIRLIHDLSRPQRGVNLYATDTSVKYSCPEMDWSRYLLGET
jgi:hypothetical protein